MIQETRLFASEKEERLFGMGPFGFLAVDVDNVNLDDLINYRPGAIVRVRGNPTECIKRFPADADHLGCIAGWISEDD